MDVKLMMMMMMMMKQGNTDELEPVRILSTRN